MNRFYALAVAGLIGGLSGDSAWATKPIAKEFKAVYLKADSSDPAQKALAEAVEKCIVCHVGKKGKDPNVYGKALSELLETKADRKDKEKIRAAFEKVAQMPSDPDNASSPKFGDLIKEGKLPGGNSE